MTMPLPPDLPDILVSPPWLSGRKPLAGRAFDLQLPPPAPEMHWPAEARDKPWPVDEAQWLERAQGDHRLVLKALLSDPEDINWQAGSALALESAWRAGDGVALGEAWLAHLHALRQANEHATLKLTGCHLSALPAEMAVAFWCRVAVEGSQRHVSFIATEVFWARHGLALLPSLPGLMSLRPGQYFRLARYFAAVELAPLMARALVKLKSMRDIARAWLPRFPQHAIAALAGPALGPAGEARTAARAALRLLAARGYEALILSAVAACGDDDALKALRAALDESPLDRYPARRLAELPDFMAPALWRRPVLRVSGEPLPESALPHLLQMLTFPTTEEVYGGIELVRQACTPASLAAFMRDALEDWMTVRAPDKALWVLVMQGHLGDDETARKVAGLLRHFSATGAKANAVMEALADLDSSVSLMLLNHIALHGKSPTLKRRAQDRLAVYAEANGLSDDDLDDRIAPDLGLDAGGTLLLDFGARQFQVGFDETLAPHARRVVDGRAGPRLASLPKPGKTDDPVLAGAATERLRLLRQDARAVAGQQLRRLELAMVSRRRWTVPAFQTYLVAHPLLRHLVQRLIWGVYEGDWEDDATSARGGRLLQGLRVNEDGGLTDAHDDDVSLADGPPGWRIGLVHPVELPAEYLTAFARLLTDYHLLQPFDQLGRDHHRLTADEEAAFRLDRWTDLPMPGAHVYKRLDERGWRSSGLSDGGGRRVFSRDLTDEIKGALTFLTTNHNVHGHVQPLLFNEVRVGRKSWRGDLGEEVPFGRLDAVTASELIRDIEALRG